jgi:hypothetical protein
MLSPDAGKKAEGGSVWVAGATGQREMGCRGCWFLDDARPAGILIRTARWCDDLEENGEVVHVGNIVCGKYRRSLVLSLIFSFPSTI